MKDNVVTGQDAIEGMTRGSSVATRIVRLSYGPGGCNAVVENDLYPYHVVANDAQTLIQAIHLENPVERRGLGFYKELMDKANKDSGDGRKTTAIIAEEIQINGLNSETSGNILKRSLDELIPLVEEEIDRQKTLITVNEVGLVATISSNSKELGDVIGEIYKNIGKDGIIHVEGSGTFNTSYSLIEGVRFNDAGYLSKDMAHDEVAKKENRTQIRAVYENPVILVTKRKISTVNDIDPLLQALDRLDKSDGIRRSLVIFTDDMDSGVASMMVNTHKSGMRDILVIKAPVIWKNYIFEDFAKTTGSTIVEDATGVNFKNLKLEHLGTCETIITDKSETTVIGIKDISDHIAELKADGSNDSLLRLQWLQTKTAILRLGANSESELSYKRLKTEDAVNASRHALQDGVVPGGGSCLTSVANLMPDTEAGRILRTALYAPMRQNMKNMGLDITGYEETPYDFGESVIDAAKIIKNAVRNGVSLASTVLTAPIVIYLPPKTPEQIAAEALQNRRMSF